MFFHNLKYELLNNIRQKEVIGWLMIFPILLSTLFSIAFGNLYNKDIAIKEIPVAVVEITPDSTFRTVMDELSTGENALFSTKYTDNNEAEKLLKKGNINNIIYVDSEISMAVSSKGLMASITRSFLEQYENRKTIISEVIVKNPEKLDSVIDALSEDIHSIETKQLTKAKMDPYTSYFQNLITMVALFGSTSGLFVATMNQGNLSPLGARKCTSPINKFKGMITSFLASLIVQIFCTFLSISYILFILKINMGNKIPMLYISGILGAFTGTSFGFLIGSIGTMSEKTKAGICTSITMCCCFLSGLMIGNIKPLISDFCPIINKINPAALISDLFYCLLLYDDYTRYIKISVTLIIMSLIFTIGGFLLTRRKKYASI